MCAPGLARFLGVSGRFIIILTFFNLISISKHLIIINVVLVSFQPANEKTFGDAGKARGLVGTPLPKITRGELL